MEKVIENLKYPDYFPQGCPPDDAETCELIVYRLCKTKEITADDFKSYYLINPNKFKDKIEAYGLSVFLTLQDCITATRKCPTLRKKYSCCSFGTTCNTGGIKHTQSKVNIAHYTWWVYEGVEPHTYFTACGLEAGENSA